MPLTSEELDALWLGIENMEARLEDTYKNHGRHPERTVITHVDSTGWRIWRKTYLYHYLVLGWPHERSMRQAIENDIDFIEGRTARWPTEPAPPDPPVPPAPVARPGIVRGNGRCVSDDGGDFLAVGKSLFWAAWGYKFDHARLTTNLEFLRGKTDYVRCLGVVGPSGWTDRTIDPRWPDFEDVIAGVTDLNYQHGLRTQWTIFGGIDKTPTRADRERVVWQFIQMAASRPEKIFGWEVANEGWQTGFGGDVGIAEARSLARLLRDNTPHLVAVTAPQDPQPSTSDARLWYENSAANMIGIHIDRNITGTGGMWRPTRQSWEVQYLAGVPRLWTGQEGRGPQSSVSEDDDPLRLTMDAALTWLCGGAGYVLHAGAGIRGGGAEDLARGRVADMWDVRNIDAILAGINAVRRLLPPDLPNWSRHNANSNFPRYPFDTDLLVPRIEDDTLLRAYAATNGNDLVVMPVKVEGDVPFKARRSMLCDVHDPLTGMKLVKTQSLDVGQTFTLKASLGLAAIFIGEYR